MKSNLPIILILLAIVFAIGCSGAASRDVASGETDCAIFDLDNVSQFGILEEGDLTADGKFYDCYLLTGTYSEGTVVNLLSREFDTFLKVELPDGKIVENDDYINMRQSRISLPEEYSDPIRITVTSYDQSDIGNYTLRVTPYSSLEQVANMRQISREGDENTIELGSTIDGELNSGDERLLGGEFYDYYYINVAEGQSVSVALESGEFETHLRLMRPDGSMLDTIGRDVDTSESEVSFTSVKDGIIQIIVSSYDINETGSYILTVEESDVQVAGLFSPTYQEATELMGNDSINSSLESNDFTSSEGQYEDWYIISLSAGDSLTVDMVSSDFDTFLILEYPDGTQEYYDDYMGELNSHIDFSAQEDGNYYIVATSYSPAAEGSYDLSVSTGGASTQPGGTGAGTVDIFGGGESITGSLQAGDETLSSGEFIDTFTFSGTQGQIVTISVESADFDTYLILIYPSGSSEYNDDISCGNYNSRIQTSLTESGEYQVMVTSYSPGESGQYSLTIPSGGQSTGGTNTNGNQGTATTQAGNSVQGSLSSDDEVSQSGAYQETIEIPVEENTNITIDLTSSDFDTYLIYNGPGGTTSQNDDIDYSGGNLNSRISSFVRQGGTASVIVTSYAAGATGNYTLSWSESEGAGSGGYFVQPGSNSIPGRQYYGIFVGIADYPGYGSDLPLCDNDATKLAESMVSSGLMQADHQTVLTNSQATPTNIRAAFSRYGGMVDDNDVFIFFYSGHGSQGRENANSDEADLKDESIYIYDGEILDNEMADLFDLINADIAILALDSCFSGGFAKDVISAPNRMGIFSSEEDLTSSVASNYDAGGYLSYYFREGLLGQADNDPQDRSITAGELSHYLILEFAQNVSSYVSASNMQGISSAGYQHVVIDRGGVAINDVIVRF